MVGDAGEMQTEERDEITIGEEYDRVYMGVNDPVLKDSGIGKTVSTQLIPVFCLKQFLLITACLTCSLTTLCTSFQMQLTVSNTAGYEDTVLWNPYGNEGMGYNNFVCVESVKV